MNLGDKIIYSKWVHIVIIALVLVGAVNWLSIGVLGIDLVRLILAPRNAKWVYILVGLAGVSLLIKRDMYLPFLGETVVPGGALVTKTPQNANQQVSIKTLPNAKILYWAAEPDPNQGKDVKSWEAAYDEFENSGVAVADSNGNAILRFRGPPQAYNVPIIGRLESHVHFRICDSTGMMGPVQIMMIKNGVIETFSNMV